MPSLTCLVGRPDHCHAYWLDSVLALCRWTDRSSVGAVACSHAHLSTVAEFSTGASAKRCQCPAESIQDIPSIRSGFCRWKGGTVAFTWPILAGGHVSLSHPLRKPCVIGRPAYTVWGRHDSHRRRACLTGDARACRTRGCRQECAQFGSRSG